MDRLPIRENLRGSAEERASEQHTVNNVHTCEVRLVKVDRDDGRHLIVRRNCKKTVSQDTQQPFI